eukprot:TRINITY_DN84233_c0_g1_i1.p2 TRINITY_DN84233_c0_g1~~TRINITY_DN84233_c0_g1_i1.p2  ORF type:complete len:110 (+),score=7.74 TRINITY_DN84233_c0_g1_i1:143-472(+)
MGGSESCDGWKRPDEFYNMVKLANEGQSYTMLGGNASPVVYFGAVESVKNGSDNFVGHSIPDTEVGETYICQNPLSANPWPDTASKGCYQRMPSMTTGSGSMLSEPEYC